MAVMKPPLDRAAALVCTVLGARDLPRRPAIVAVDGRSGTGKSTFAARLATITGAGVIEGDDFYAGGVGIERDSRSARVARCIDWRKQREVLEALIDGRSAHWRAFDWLTFNGQQHQTPRTLTAGLPLVILEGVYSARPELADLIDIAILLRATSSQRRQRLRMRDGPADSWDRQWREAETWYFTRVLVGRCFDLILDL